MFLTREIWILMFQRAAQSLKANADILSRLDSAIGDGDHGVTINKIADKIAQLATNWQADTPTPKFFEELSEAITNIGGGSAGPLWGTFLEGLGAQATEQMDAAQVKLSFESACQTLAEISGAKVGDKTMMDAIIPAVQSIQAADGDIPSILSAGAMAAAQGADNTANFAAKFGRAKNLKEKSLGHKDPGAVSIALLFAAFAEAVQA